MITVKAHPMKYSLCMMFILLFCCVRAQKNIPEDIYPVPKVINVKPPKNGDETIPAPLFEECLNGDCENGAGTRLKIDGLAKNASYQSYHVYFTLQKGEFSDGGKTFNGKVYRPRVMFIIKDKKQMVPATAFDFTNDSLLKPFYAGEGQQQNNKWNGKAKITTAFRERYPDLNVHELAFSDNTLVWMDVSFPAGHRFSRFTGRTFPSGYPMSGKAILKNGDVYEGFFFGPNFLGPGRLTKKNGKVKQGIWQLDSLLVAAPLEFSSAVLDPVLPANAAPTSGNYPVIRGIKQLNPEFYGQMQNNEASGWGLMKMQFYQAPGHHTMLGYGKWANNQLDGPGIFIDEGGGSLVYASGIFKNGVLEHGVTWHTNLSTSWPESEEETRRWQRLREEIPRMGITYPNFIWMYAGRFANGALSGCGMTNQEIHVGRFFDKRIQLSYPVEGNFKNGSISGFYFYGDTARKHAYENLRYTNKITEETIKMAEAETSFCFDVMIKYQAFYVAEMKKRLAGDIAEKEWRESPEGKAHAQRVAQANKEFAAQKKKECDAKFAKVGTRGSTYYLRGEPVILDGYDCATDEFIAWRPWQPGDSYDNMAMTQVRGYAPLITLELYPKQYQSCTDCDGTGKVIVVTTKTRTKDLPWGYFSGIETKSIRTTTTETLETCDKCHGMAIILK